MKFKVVVHTAEEGGYWAEVPAVPGCISEGENLDELIFNIREALEGCLSVELPITVNHSSDQVIELAL